MKHRRPLQLIALLLALTIVFGQTLAVGETIVPAGNDYGFAGTNGKYYTDFSSFEEEQLVAKDLAIEVASEGFVMLKNENDALPLEKGARVSLFGMHSVDLVTSTVGSAAGTTGANGIEMSTLPMAMENAGFKVNPKLTGLYEMHHALGTADNELPLEYYSTATTSTYNGYNDAAIIVFSRTGSEGVDKRASNVDGHSDPMDHELMLDDNEKALVKHVKEYYPDTPIIVLINSSNIFQIPELAEDKATSEYGVDAIFWIGNPGNNGIEAIGKLLSGEVNPSGRTVEVWEKDFRNGPTWTNFGQQYQNLDENGEAMDAYFYYEGEPTIYANIEYREGIYLGYKYYETACDDMNAAEEGTGDEWYDSQVLYPFGYGLSYTDFAWEIAEPATETVITNPHQIVSMSVKVTNVGNTAGKDVVQIYANPPYTVGGIEKASANLVGFAKTDLLQPGESQVLTIDFVAQDMASFDWNDANENGFSGYELEAGTYSITARRNSHEVVLEEVYTIENGLNCTTDYTSGEEITPLFVGDYTSVNDSLLNNMISRATGLVQPEPASVEDRTIDADYLALMDNQYTYHSYMDQGYEDWYVYDGGTPATWTQAAARNEGDVAEISILDMTGVDFELDIENGAVVQGTDEGSLKWEQFMNQLTWEELTSLVRNGGGVQDIPAVGVVAIGASETPLQLNGGTLWPCPPIQAATFNVDLIEELGVMIGNEALFTGTAYWQGNAMNIHRSPLSGRNVEYYSQDGMHGGAFAAAVAKGVTSKGVTCHIKHMMLNDQESYRDLNGGVFTWATEQVIREIYARPFEHALKEGNSTGIMGSFNRIGNINAQLNGAMKSLVHDEWDNRAIFETDAWQGTYCPIDLMVRQGNQQILGTGSEIPVVDMEIGTWDPELNCVQVSNGGDGTFPSYTHYAAVRKAAQEILWNYCNGNGIKNGYSNLEGAHVRYDVNANQSQQIAFEGIDYQDVVLAEGTTLPEGLTLGDYGLISGATSAEGEMEFDVDLLGVDGYITLSNVPVYLEIGSAVHVNGATDVAVGDNVEITIDAPHYKYGATADAFSIPAGFGNDTYSIPEGTNTIVQGFGGESDASLYEGIWGILNWYWVNEDDPFGSGETGRGALAAEDAQSTDTRSISRADIDAGNYYKAFEYGFEIAEEDIATLESYGLTVAPVMTNFSAANGSYEYESALSITGTPTQAGTVEFDVTFTCPLVRAFPNGSFPNAYGQATPLCLPITTTVTLNIA